MPYVQRNAQAKVTGLFAKLQPGHAEEFLDDTNAEVIAYRNPPPPTADQLAATDADQKAIKAALLVVRTYCNGLKAGTYTAKTIPEVRDDFIQAWKSLP